MRIVIVNIICAAILGAILWAISPYYTGQVEPWDAETSYYPASLFAAGFVLGLSRPRFIWSHPIGIVLGQFIYQLIFLTMGPLVLIGILFLIVFSLFSLAGSFVGKTLRVKFNEMKLKVGSDE